MSEIIEEVTHSFKAHPYLIGGAVLLFVIIIAKSGGGSSSTASQGLAVGLQSQATQLQAGVAQSQIAAGAATQQAQYAAAAQASSDQSFASVLGTLVSAKVASDQNSQNYALASQQTKASQEVADTQLGDNLSFQNSNLHAQLDAYGQSIGLQSQGLALQSTALANNYDLASKSLNYTNSNLPALVAFNEYMANLTSGTNLSLAQIQSGTTVNVAQIGSQTQENIAKQQASAAETASIAGAAQNIIAPFSSNPNAAGILGSVASLFG